MKKYIGLTLICGALLGAVSGCNPLRPGSDTPTTSGAQNAPATGTCGAVGQPCCSNSTCNNGATCSNNVCAAVTPVLTPQPAPVACGAVGQPCCNGTACGSGAMCANGACVAQPAPGTCGGFGQLCCAGNTCPNGLGLACGSNGICAAANSLPPTQPTMPSAVPGFCITNDGRIGTTTGNGAPCNPIPVMGAPTNPNAPRIVSALDLARFTDSHNPSSLCAALDHNNRTTLNDVGPQCFQLANGRVHCSTVGANGRQVYWARSAGSTIDVDNACENDSPQRRVYVMFERDFYRRAETGQLSVHAVANELQRSLGLPADVACKLANGLHERSSDLHTEAAGEVPTLPIPTV